MNIRQRILLALTSALFLAGLCTFVLNRTMVHAAAGHAGSRYYVTPTRAIHPGEILHGADIKVLAWPADNTVHGAIVRREDAADRVALTEIVPGEPLLDAHLAPLGSGTGLASRIPNGMRAIALKSDEVIGVAGFLNPGSHVDVLVTCHNSFGGDAVTSTVLQNVEVVATNQQIAPDPNGKPTTATVVTLLLTPPQAQRALLASNQGSLQLVLRNSSDRSTSDAAPVLLSQIAPPSYGTQSPALGTVPLPTATTSSPSIPKRASASSRPAKHATTENSGGVEMVYGGQSLQAAQTSASAMNLSGGKL